MKTAEPAEQPKRAGIMPHAAWTWARRLTQSLALLALLLAPFLGGWQRLDRNHLATWNGLGWDLPHGIMTRLPIGDASRRAYEVNQMLGGGVAVDYVGLPAVDPVAGTLALLWTSNPTPAILVAWLIPIVLGLVAGRVFCGWFCPFGTLSRWIDIGLRHLAPRWPRLALPRRRWLRFAILLAALVFGALGAQWLLYLSLPHALLEQATYGMWLMGGGGAALGACLGLLLVGLVFGPTAYCATVCPTGAALALLGRARVVHLSVVDHGRCAKACDLCDRACWLDLEPSAGNPGPDCDLCTRCTLVCPHANLHIVGGKAPAKIERGVHVAMLALLCSLAGGCTASPWREDPRLLLETVTHEGSVDVHLAVIDVDGFRMQPTDSPKVGTEIYVYLARGPRGEADEHGKLAARDVYLGPLELRVFDDEGDELSRTRLAQPNHSPSVGYRTIYHGKVEVVLEPGARVEIPAIPEWTTESTIVQIPTPNLADGPLRLLAWLAAGFACFGGLVALAIAGTPERPRAGPS